MSGPFDAVQEAMDIFPNPDALERLTTAAPIEMHDEWIARPRR